MAIGGSSVDEKMLKMLKMGNRTGRLLTVDDARLRTERIESVGATLCESDSTHGQSRARWWAERSMKDVVNREGAVGGVSRLDLRAN